jgi:hypothetical protein
MLYYLWWLIGYEDKEEKEEIKNIQIEIKTNICKSQLSNYDSVIEELKKKLIPKDY